VGSIFAVYGASGCGRGVMPIARAQESVIASATQVIFIDDGLAGRELNGHKVLSYVEFLSLDAENRFVSIAIADSRIREQLWGRCESDGILPWQVKASNVVVFDEVRLGPGAILCPFVTLTSNIRIGRQFHANIYSYVEHDCVIGDFVTFAPGVKCNGNVVIEDHAYIGTGAILKQGRPGKPLVIGRGAVVGMGAVVTNDVPAGVTVIGSPARLMARD
jgi:sugar O-acyltransferase (sialic acid O-acetyltransferase NeuD family)